MYLTHFVSEPGTSLDISEIPALGQDAELAGMFRNDGFTTFYRDTRPLAEMVSDFVPRYLAETGIPPRSIGAVYLVSDSLGFDAVSSISHSPAIALRNALFKVLADMGMSMASPVLVGGAGCANLGLALEMVHGHFASGLVDNALVLFADKFADDDKRIMPLIKTNRLAAGTIGSDIVAGCLLSRSCDEPRRLRVKGLAKTNHLAMISAYSSMAEGGGQAGYVLETVKGLMKFKSEATARFGKSLSDFERVYVGNYTKSYFRIYGLQFGWEAGTPDMSTKSDLAHAQSLDGLISIFRQNMSIQDGLMFLIGPAMWAGISFDFTKNGAP